MKSTTKRILVGAFAAALLVASCSDDETANTTNGTEPPASSETTTLPSGPTAQPGSGTVAGLARFLPATTTLAGFTDYAALQRAAGVQLTSASDSTARRDLFMRTAKDLATASSFAMTDYQVFADAWGFDASDFTSELSMIGSTGPAHVATFAEHFDMSTLTKRFEEYGFQSSSRDQFTVYSHELDVSAPWMKGPSGIMMTNVAVDADQRLIVAGSSAPAVSEMLDAAQANAPAADVVAALDALDGSMAIQLTPQACSALDIDSVLGAKATPEQIKQMRARLHLEVHPYRTVAIGVASDGARSTGKIAMVYDAPADAEADLDARRNAADEGDSVRTGQKFSESVFTVDGASVDGSTLIIEVSPLGNLPSRLLTMLETRDLPFAACP